jgi:hypothetical protein
VREIATSRIFEMFFDLPLSLVDELVDRHRPFAESITFANGSVRAYCKKRLP